MKERGKNSIQLNGGVSGIAGSFIGFSYATNNFLGLGRNAQPPEPDWRPSRIPSPLASHEPYLFDKPIQAGFTVYLQRFNYDQAREASIFSGQNLIPYYQSLGANNLLNYVSNGRGLTTFLSYQLTPQLRARGPVIRLRYPECKADYRRRDDIFHLPEFRRSQRPEFSPRHQDQQDHADVFL